MTDKDERRRPTKRRRLWGGNGDGELARLFPSELYYVRRLAVPHRDKVFNKPHDSNTLPAGYDAVRMVDCHVIVERPVPKGSDAQAAQHLRRELAEASMNGRFGYKYMLCQGTGMHIEWCQTCPCAAMVVGRLEWIHGHGNVPGLADPLDARNPLGPYYVLGACAVHHKGETFLRPLLEAEVRRVPAAMMALVRTDVLFPENPKLAYVSHICSAFGVGRELLEYVEEVHCGLGFDGMALHSLMDAYGFYTLRMGYLPHDLRSSRTFPVQVYRAPHSSRMSARPYFLFESVGDKDYQLVKPLCRRYEPAPRCPLRHHNTHRTLHLR